MVRAFKHWDKQWADDLTERGRLRLMPLTYYRQEFEREGVQDKRENVAYFQQRGQIGGPGPVNEADRRRLSLLGIHVQGNVQGLRATGNTASWRGEMVYVFCLTKVAKAGLFKASDEVTTIPNVAKFASALLSASEGRFRRIEQRAIKYDGAVQFVEDVHYRGPDPFVKWPNYAYQQEIRIALYPNGQLDGEVFLESPLIRRALGL